MEKRYRWFAEHLLDIRSFIQKTKRFDDKSKTAEELKTKADNAKLKTKANNAKLKTKANNAKLKT